MEENRQIELRSEKVRNIIGQVPPVLLRYGNSIIALSLLILVVIAMIIPYQKTYNISLTVNQRSSGELIYIARIPQKIMKKESEFDHVSTIATYDLPLPERFKITSISSTTLISDDGVWRNAELVSIEEKSTDIKLESPITLQGTINLKKTSVLKWILNY